MATVAISSGVKEEKSGRAKINAAANREHYLTNLWAKVLGQPARLRSSRPNDAKGSGALERSVFAADLCRAKAPARARHAENGPNPAVP